MRLLDKLNILLIFMNLEKEMDYFVKKATEMIIEEINKKRLTPAST